MPLDSDLRCDFLPEEEMDPPEPWFEKHGLGTQRWAEAGHNQLLLLP